MGLLSDYLLGRTRTVRRAKLWNRLPERTQDLSLEGLKNRLKNVRNLTLGQKDGLDDFKMSISSLFVSYSAFFSSTQNWTGTTQEFDTCWQPRW